MQIKIENWYYEDSIDILKENISTAICTFYGKKIMQCLQNMSVEFIVNEKESDKCIECKAKVAHSDK